jgi:hypothetical protein
MNIVSIFAEKLFSFHYDNEVDNEFDRLMDLWTDASYLQAFAKRNKVKDVYGFINEILECANEIQDFLEEISQKNNKTFSYYFEVLQLSETNKILSFHKGKIRYNKLRLYAIKIDEDCFVITGGAIKMSQKMQDHPDTDNELQKLTQAKSYLTKKGVSDIETFFELIQNNI